jgi:flagellar L-ring protein precursor FlgH
MRALALTAAVLLAACAHRAPLPETAPARPVFAPQAPAEPGALYTSGRSLSLFQDRKARQVGDVITVLLVERTDAKKSATTATSKDSNVGISAPVAGFPLTKDGVDLAGIDLNSSQSFAGNGNSAQSNALSGSVSVLVVELLPNGLMVVQGEKQLSINQGSERLYLSGLIRSEDVGPDNTVRSDRVANASIRYGGAGAVADANRQGWLARFFNSGFWPF